MNTHTKKGFTIIEVVLVLAIAALIFLMVFIALPALQRNQRDQARKQDVTNVAGAVNSYTGNNRGGFPDSTELSSYVEDISDNTETVQVRTATGAGTFTADDAIVYVTEGSRCDSVGADGSVTLEDGTARQYTVVTRLESGNGSGFCLDS